MAKNKHSVIADVYSFDKNRITVEHSVWVDGRAVVGGSFDLTLKEAKYLLTDLKEAIANHKANFGKNKESK